MIYVNSGKIVRDLTLLIILRTCKTMKLKLTALTLISSLFLISCGASKAKTACLDNLKKSVASMKKAGAPMKEEMRKSTEAACNKL